MRNVTLILLLVVLCFSALGDGCLDYSGRYRTSEVDEVMLTINQEKCDHIDIRFFRQDGYMDKRIPARIGGDAQKVCTYPQPGCSGEWCMPLCSSNSVQKVYFLGEKLRVSESSNPYIFGFDIYLFYFQNGVKDKLRLEFKDSYDNSVTNSIYIKI
ncbi:MAG: hypothetical protein N4A33_00960 [Bacteriovoracaceae bacterium]|nr:hypothetical protein [Bacteriovoracaceae bacterium]